MKPDWCDAPEWAKFLARDQQNHWHWYEKKPHKTIWNCWISEGRELIATTNCSVQWQNSLEERPELQ